MQGILSSIWTCDTPPSEISCGRKYQKTIWFDTFEKQLKYYNQLTSQWENIVKYTAEISVLQGSTGAKGEKGDIGSIKFEEGPSHPDDTQAIWIDTSSSFSQEDLINMGISPNASSVYDTIDNEMKTQHEINQMLISMIASISATVDAINGGAV